jgi:type 1 glutamine amidotransferase
MLLLFAAAAVLAAVPPSTDAAEKTRVLLVTGGHGFERPQFFKIFEDNPDITFKAVEHPDPKKQPDAADPFHPLLKPDAARSYDVIVLYDMWQKITEEAKTDLVNWLKSGKGLVSLHHSIANYQQWPEWPRIVGGRYYLEKTVVEGVEKPRSIWKHDVKFKVHVADPNHPVTRGVRDFEIHDETYGLFDMAPGSHALLTTDEPTSAKHIGWANNYEGARVVYLQLGHDHFAYENPNYRQLVRQAIRWVARQP